MRRMLRKRSKETIAAIVGDQTWYHTIDLGDGIVTPGLFDHSQYVHLYGFPEDLSGKRVIDIGTANGFFAFEFEKRGAAEVVAVDVAPPEVFDFCRKTLGSKVRYLQSDIYDLDPKKLGMFDLVFCGDLLMHLDDIIGAVRKIRLLSREHAIITSVFFDGSDETIPLAHAPMTTKIIPALRGSEKGIGRPEAVTWIGNRVFYRRLLEYVGFSMIEIVSVHIMKPRQGSDVSPIDSISHIVIRGEI